LGYHITASDISSIELAEAQSRADERGLGIRFARADFRTLEDVFAEQFNIVIAMDNALPHMLTSSDLQLAIQSIVGRMQAGGIFVASIRDYDVLLKSKPPYSPPYIHEVGDGRRVSFQTWSWKGQNYHLVQYIIDDADELHASKFECEYRATRRQELTDLLLASGCSDVVWRTPEETGFYQPIVIAKM